MKGRRGTRDSQREGLRDSQTEGQREAEQESERLDDLQAMKSRPETINGRKRFIAVARAMSTPFAGRARRILLIRVRRVDEAQSEQSPKDQPKDPA